MFDDSYENYIQLLRLSRHATDREIRETITNELRTWTRRVNASTLDARQEAERMVKTLEAAERVLLGPAGAAVRGSQNGSHPAETEPAPVIDAEFVASAIQKVTSSKGTKTQQRDGTVLFRRATIFYQGVTYVTEELVHKNYEAARDKKRCSARNGELVLFDWSCEMSIGMGQGRVITYVPGQWVGDLVMFAAESEGTTE